MDRPIPPGWEPNHLLEAMEANLARHLAYFPRHMPAGAVHETEDIVLADSGVSSDTFNAVCRARLNEPGAEAAITWAIEHFRSKGLPFAWWVGPTSSPADLPARLLAHGLSFAEAEVGMSLDLSHLAAPEGLLPGVEVRRVRTHRELVDYAQVVAANCEPPDRPVMEVYERCATKALAPGEPAHFFLGYRDGHAVATSECFLAGGVAGIYNVVTLPQARRRGIGTALTWAAIEDACRSGYTVAVLQASAQGQSMYSRLGFVPCCDFREYH